MNEDEVTRLIVKAFKEKELLKIGNRSYLNVFRYPESRFDSKDLMPNGGSPQALDPSPMLQPLQDPSKRFFDQVVIPPSYLIFKIGNVVYAKNGLTGQIEFSGTDASAVIQSAINALPTITYTELGEVVTGKVGTLEFKEGVYYNVSFSIPAGSWLRIKGQYPLGQANVDLSADNVVGGTVLDGDPTKDYIIKAPRSPYTYSHTKLSLENLALRCIFPADPATAKYLFWSQAFELLLKDVDVSSNRSGTGAAPITGIYLDGEPWSSATTLERVGVISCWFGIYVKQEHIVISDSLVRGCGHGIYVAAAGAFKRGGISNTQLFNNVEDLTVTGAGSEIHLDSVLIEHSAVPANPVVVTNGRKLIISALRFTPSGMTLSTLFSNLSDVIFLTPVISCHNPYTVLRVKNSGTATITAGATYVDVTHGLAITPDINKIAITPQDNLGGRSFWISDVTSTTFRINISSTDTVDHVFGWSYE